MIVSILKQLIDPMPWLIAAAAVWLYKSGHLVGRQQRFIASFVVAGLALSGMPAVQKPLTRAVEYGCPVDLLPAKVGAVVVLGGGVSRRNRAGTYEPSGESAARLLTGLRVFRLTGARYLVLAGGSTSTYTEAEVIARAAGEAAIPAASMILDPVSLNTWQHAEQLSARQELKGVPFAIVTSAIHMRRAMNAFHRVALPVVAVPVACEDTGPFRLRQLIPGVGSLQRTHAALYESIGLAWYLVRGLI